MNFTEKIANRNQTKRTKFCLTNMDCLKMKVLICLMLMNGICILTTKRKIKPLKKILKSKTESIHETKIPPAVESDQARKFIIRTNGRSLNVDNHNGLYIDYSHPYFPFGHTTYAHVSIKRFYYWFQPISLTIFCFISAYCKKTLKQTRVSAQSQ